MENIGYDLFLTVISSILGELFGVLISRLLNGKDKTSEIHVDKQLIFSQIHIEQKQYIVNTVESREKNSNGINKSRNENTIEIIIGCVIVALLLVYGFLKYDKQISAIILCTFVFLEVTFLTTAYITVKNHYVDKSIKVILLFNVLAAIGVPILLYFEQNPITVRTWNKQEILHQVETSGMFALLSDGELFGFLLYQAVGVIILVGFMIFTLIGLMHVLSMVNLTLKNGMDKVWSWVFKKSFAFCKSVKFYMFFGIFLLVLSFLFVSGVLSMILTP